MSNILQINSQDYDDDDIIAGNVIVNNEGKTQEIIVNVQESERGPRGVGIPEGGTPGQVMVKQSLEDFNVAWTNLDIPTKTSDLINDTDFVSDDHYVHTDNNFTTPEKEKLDNLANITTIGDNLTLTNGRLDASGEGGVTSVNEKTGDVVLDAEDVGAVKEAWGADKANKNLVTDASGNVITADYALGQIIVDYYEELPTNVPETAKASVVYPSSYTAEFTTAEIDDSIDNSTICNNFIITESPARPSSEGGYVSLYSEDGRTIDMAYSVSGGATEAVYSVSYGDENGISHEYYYSFIRQEYAYSGEETVYLEVGWNEVFYDEETGNPYVVQIQYSDLPVLTDITFASYYDNNTGFIKSFGHTAYHLAGEYMYVEVTPSTTPKTYYWKYNPTNVQADMSEDDPASLAYIRNRAILDTTSSSGLATGTETIKDTVRLHKISKTALYSDLINAVGRGSGNGEIFNTYSGQYKNTAMGLASHAEGYHTESTGNYSHAEGYFTTVTGEKGHVEGYGGAATGEAAHAENINTTASGIASHAEGNGTRASGDAQHVQGKFNVVDSQNTYAHIVGNGTADNARSNAHTLDWNGNAWFKGDIRVGGTSWDTGTPVGGGSEPYRKTLTNASQNYSVSNNVVTVTDADVTTSTMVNLYPANTTTETWLENNLASCIITEATGSFSFNISASLPATFSMYYIITEVQ